MTQDRIPLDMEGETELLPCPFCGGKPRVDLAKKTFCQLHGEPSQAVRVYCYHDCPSRPSVEAGDTFNGGEAQARAVAIAAWNRRALPSAPAVEWVEPVAWVRAWNFQGRPCVEEFTGNSELAELWRGHPQTDEVRPLYPASAISRLVKERDEKQAALQRIADEHLPHVEALEASVARLTALLAEADAQRTRQEERVRVLEEALWPFASYLDLAAFDLDNSGNPLPDDQGMGWTYLTVGDFRRARAALGNGGGDA